MTKHTRCFVIMLALVGCESAPNQGAIRDAGLEGDVRARTGPPWVVAAPGGRYFQTADGKPFVPIGHQASAVLLDLPDGEIEAHFARMESYGENVMRLDFDNFIGPLNGGPRYAGLESRLGVYDPTRVARLDLVFQKAAAHGVRILVVPWITSPPLHESWPLNPYSRAQGGVADDPYGFLVQNDARRRFGDRLEWISNRWGSGGTFFAWDLMNESNILLRNETRDAPELESWVTEIGGRVRNFEQKTFGGSHIRMVSWVSMVPPPSYRFLLTSPVLSAASTHPYDIYGTNVLKDGSSTRTSLVEPPIAAHQKIREIIGRIIGDRRPYLENERHQNHSTPLTFHREADHNMAWAELTSGAAGTGITWLVVERSAATQPLDAHGYVARHMNLGPVRRALRDFVDLRVPPEFFLSPTTDESGNSLLTDNASVVLMSVRRGKHAIGWMVGRDDRCVQVDVLKEVNSNNQRGARYTYETLLGIVIWVKLLRSEGIPIDESKFAALMKAIAAKDVDAAEREVPGVVAYLDSVEASTGALARLAKCPKLSPPVRFAMPEGSYRVDWVSDTDASVIRSDNLLAGTSTLSPPEFERHIAVVVRPR